MAASRVFFPKADASVLSYRHAAPPTYPETVGPVYDPEQAEIPILPWPSEAEKSYPPQEEPYAPAIIPEKNVCLSDLYLRATLAHNERLRLSMLWYYTRDIFEETEFLAGLQEKVSIAQETAEWEFAILGILDVNFYTRLAAIGVPLGILPRGETICAHTVAQPPGNVFLLPNMLEDWRFEKSPYVEYGGISAYAGAPLRLQNESGDTVCLGSICVASPTPQEPLTRAQQTTLVRLADWVVSDIVQLTRARRQRVRRRMVELIAAAQIETTHDVSEEPVVRILQTMYPDAVVSLQSTKAGQIEAEGRATVPLSDFSDGLWEDFDFIDDFIAKSNHQELPTLRVVRAIAAPCESVSGPSSLVVGSKDFRQVFDDIDAWFVQSCANIISQMWQKRLLDEVMIAKEKFLRGFSHQLRTPIHGILGSVELLAEELNSRNLQETATQTIALLQATAVAKSGEEAKDYLNTIKRAGRDLISIINSMITLNRWADVAIMERQYAPHTIHELEAELANETLKTISGDARYNSAIVFNHNSPPDHYTFRTDIGLMRDSLLPLIINAIQNTTAGVVAITISLRPGTKELVVEIEDTGRGIPSTDHQRIFELYEQVDDYSTGAGLGLTLSSRFAALLDGSVDLVSSTVGLGSHFKATFRGMDCACSDVSLPSQPLLPQLESLPTGFHVMPRCPESLTLCGRFTKFLTSCDFSSSDNIKDSLVIFDSTNDMEWHCTALSQVPQDQVAICLVATEEDVPCEKTSPNVIFVHGPFLTTTMISALERADKLLTSIEQKSKNQLPSLGDLSAPEELNEALYQDVIIPAGGAAIATEAKTAGLDQGSTLVDTSATAQRRLTPDILDKRKAHEEKPDVLEGKGSADSPHVELAQLSLINPPEKDPVASTVLNRSSSNAEKRPSPLAEYHFEQSISSIPDFATISHPTALLVDDNAVNLRVMQMYCNKRNLPYMCAKDGLQAVSMFREYQESAIADKTKSPIQLILMDLQMPGCDGIEATRQIRKLEEERNWQKTVLFIVTGQDSPADRKAADEAGSQQYHVKPVSIKSLDTGLKMYFPSFGAASGT